MPLHPSPARRGVALVAALACLLLVAWLARGVFSDDPQPSTPAQPLPSGDRVPSGQDALASFYNQSLDWSSCSAGAQCAKLTVPLDYAHPDGGSIKISLLKVPARDSKKRIGSLVVNPGGPGGSGVDYAKSADFIVGAPVRKVFDIVGFDPRGVASSEPITCVDPPKLDAFLGQDPTPDDRSEEEKAAQIATDFGLACKARAGALLAHVSTIEAAKDMDILRAALGDAKLNFLGKSYGTYLGATYAGLFPTNVGRFVLDGVLAPDLTPEEMSLGQAKGFDTATKAWAAHCVEEGNCPLGDSVDAVMSGLGALLTKLDAHPAPVKGDARVRELTEGWAAYGIAGAMYDQGLWDYLTADLRTLVEKNDGTELMGLADVYAQRDKAGNYEGNMMQVIYAVNCLDLPDTADLNVYEERAKRAAVEAPLFGRFLAWSGLTCGHWPVQSGHKPAKISAAGSGPIVVIGTTRDPATPYEWATRLADQLQNGIMVTYDGDGHTAYTRSNSCIDDAIDKYYVAGVSPPDGLKC